MRPAGYDSSGLRARRKPYTLEWSAHPAPRSSAALAFNAAAVRYAHREEPSLNTPLTRYPADTYRNRVAKAKKLEPGVATPSPPG
jgi:hypothetical protein